MQQHYFKAQAYRITPQGPGNLAIDGEKYNFKPFVVECHRGLGTLLSPTGHYAAEFTVPKPGEKSREQSDGNDERPGTLPKIFCC